MCSITGYFWHIRAFGAAYTTAYLTRLTELPACDLMVYSHTCYRDPREGGWAATQLIGSNREQWAPYNALVGWKRVTGNEVLATEKDLAPGVFAMASRDTKTGDIGLVMVNYGFAQRQKRDVLVSLEHMDAGQWRINGWRVDPDHSSRMDAQAQGRDPAEEDDLDLVEDRKVQVRPSEEPQLHWVLPPHSSSFVRLRRATEAP